MPDDRFYDAINLFKYSSTAQGNIAVDDDDVAYRPRYERLATDVLDRLWALWAADDIGFHDLGTKNIGESGVHEDSDDILVHSLLCLSRNPATYARGVEQVRLAAVSCVLVHEATHLVHDVACYHEQEVLCRTIEASYFKELTGGRGYQSRITGTYLVAQFKPSGVPVLEILYSEFNELRLKGLLRRQLVDQVLNMSNYRRDLLEPDTARYISRSLDWWGGLRNRKPETRGYYLQSLAAQNGVYGQRILKILESLSRGEWNAARSCAGDMGRIRSALRGLDPSFSNRIVMVQEVLGQYFGMHLQGTHGACRVNRTNGLLPQYVEEL